MSLEFTLAQINFLRSPAAVAWLTKAESLPLTATTRLQDLQKLRQKLTAEEASAVIEQVLLRRRAAQKFERAGAMLFFRDALEQATHQRLANHRAAQMTPYPTVIDLGCGIGADSLALARHGRQVHALDLHPGRLKFAQHNARVYDVADKISLLQGDALRVPTRLADGVALFADPARRRTTGARTFNPDEFSPPLKKLMTTFANRPLAIKTAPGLDFRLLAGIAHTIEMVSLDGALKEAVLWLNQLAHPHIRRRATLLNTASAATISLDSTTPDDCPVGPLGNYLFEPDPAIIRAGLVKQAGFALNLQRIDAKLAYLSGDAPLQSPLVTGYAIQARLSLQARAVNRYLKAHHISRVDVKQRGSGVTPEKFLAQLKPAKQGQTRTLILTRLDTGHVALITKRIKDKTKFNQ